VGFVLIPVGFVSFPDQLHRLALLPSTAPVLVERDDSGWPALRGLGHSARAAQGGCPMGLIYMTVMSVVVPLITVSLSH
jgi:hypothetical protein